jgi:hypothetical protein
MSAGISLVGTAVLSIALEWGLYGNAGIYTFILVPNSLSQDFLSDFLVKPCPLCLGGAQLTSRCSFSVYCSSSLAPP